MNIRNRLAALEGRQLESAVSNSGAPNLLVKRLQATAERIRETPLNKLTANASPLEVAALIMDGRVDDEVARQCVEFSKHETGSAALFSAFLDAANSADCNPTQKEHQT